MNDVYVILVNYNGYNDTIECIKSIKENNEIVKIIVVDNNSTDNSVAKLKKIENITLIESKENLGFAKGNNLGIKYAIDNKAKYIMLLNNDTEIKNNTISILKDKLIHDDSLGIVGSRIMYYNNPNLINYCGGHINWLKAISVHERYKEEVKEELAKFFYTDFITGCCMMIKKEVFDTVGLLPEEYFMYFEDVDFCVKVSEAGYKLGICTESVVLHKVSAASGGEDSPFSIEWMTRNRLIFMNKYKKKTKGIYTVLFFYISRLIKLLSYKVTGKIELFNAITKGINEAQTFLKAKQN